MTIDLLARMADPRKTRSVRVVEKLGMKQEGLLRSHVVWRGEPADRMYFGVVRNEWETTKRADLPRSRLFDRIVSVRGA